MKSSTSCFMKYIYYCAKTRHGKNYRNVIQEAMFKYQCYIMRGKKKKFTDVLIECNILSENESKASNIKSAFLKIKDDKFKIENQETEVEKNYKKYRHLVQYFVYRYGIGRLPISPAIDFDDITHDCWLVILRNVDFTNHHKAIVAYIAKTVRTQCIRSCARMLHIKIPNCAFQKIRYANKWPNRGDSWKILTSPGNKFVVPIKDVDIATTEKENFEYEHLKNILIGMLDKLSIKERFILKYRFGPEKMTLEEIGRILHYTRERVRQIEEISIRKLRCWMIAEKDLTTEERKILRTLPMKKDEFMSSRVCHK